MARILFYAKRNLHLPHLEPIRRWLAENRPDVDVRVSSPPWTASSEGRPGVGLTDTQVGDLERRGIRWIAENDLAAWAPDATVLADADFFGISWGGRIVNVNHGLISKGFYYTTTPHVKRENAADLICVPGEHHAGVLRQMLQKPVVASGLVKFDPVGRGELTKASARKSFGVPEQAEVVLFAPTFNLELSAVPVLTDRVREIVRPNRYLLIKLHGMAPSIWVEMYRLLARLDDHIVYVDGNDITPSLVAADVVISDVSSAYMEAVALDRPVVLVNNPYQKQYYNYDPNDIEYAWRDVGLQANSAAETLAAVERSFEYPEEKAGLRQTYGPRLVGPIDGRAAERAATAILHLVGAAGKSQAQAVSALSSKI